MPHVYIRFTHIWRNYNPGDPARGRPPDMASFEIAAPGEKDSKGKKVEKIGDRILRSAGERVEPEEAVKHLSLKELKRHGYTDKEIESALKDLKPEDRERHEKFNAGELEREHTAKEAARASVRR